MPVPMASLLTGLIDSGTDLAPVSRRFMRDTQGALVIGDAVPDQLGHGTAVANILLSQSPGLRLLNAQVFGASLTCSARQVAQALYWLVDEGAQLINMSFGLHGDRTVLRKAVVAAQEAGVILVAASPARGAAVFPASYPGVIRATGDARCAADEISLLASAQADFGGHVHAGGGGPSGASVGCAYVCAHAARFLNEYPAASVEQLCVWLKEKAVYHGPERRTQ